MNSDDTEESGSDGSEDEAEFTSSEAANEVEAEVDGDESNEADLQENACKRKLSADDRLYRRTLDHIFLYPNRPLEAEEDDGEREDDDDYDDEDPEELGDEEVVRNYARVLRERN